jgi:aspartate carbamoyltransferase regulatory subunit
MEPEKLYVEKIKNGTVIDHIRSGYALKVLEILNLDGKDGRLITMAMNVKSSSSENGKKDIIKVSDTLLDEEQINQIACISDCKVSFIENFNIKEKFIVQVPEKLSKIINDRCVTNKEREPISSLFTVISKEPIFTISCDYCGRILKREEILENL